MAKDLSEGSNFFKNQNTIKTYLLDRKSWYFNSGCYRILRNRMNAMDSITSPIFTIEPNMPSNLRSSIRMHLCLIIIIQTYLSSCLANVKHL